MHHYGSNVDKKAFLLKIENEFVFAKKEFGDVSERLFFELKVILTKMISC
jgi:hypothetical protein